MSSPKILSWVQVSHDEAVAANRGQIEHYLELARQIAEQGEALTGEIRSMSVTATDLMPPLPLMSYEEASAKAWSQFAQTAQASAGKPALEFAHAYWQSLKHPWIEMVLKRHATVSAVAAELAAQERARLDEIDRAVDASVSIEAQFDAVAVDASSAAPIHSWPARSQATIDQIVALSDPVKLDSIRRAISACDNPDPQFRWMQLEALRLDTAQRAKEMRLENEIRLYAERRRALLLERIQAQVQQCQVRLDSLASENAEVFAKELQSLQTRMAQDDIDDAVEESVQALERKVIAEGARCGLINDAVKHLYDLGYTKVQMMHTLEPADIVSVYMEDPLDPERVAQVQISATHKLISSEIVRRQASNGSSAQRQGDHSAQVRLCRAMVSAEAALSERWQLSVHTDTAPGGPVRAKAGIPRSGRRAVRPAAKTHTQQL